MRGFRPGKYGASLSAHDYDGSVATLVFALRLVLAVVFATAGIGKLLDRPGSVKALSEFGVKGSAARVGGVLLPVLELAVACGLLFPPTVLAAAIGALVLLLAFIGGISRALVKGLNPDCHCFGQIHSAPAGPSTLIRNGVLAALAVVVLVKAPGPAIDTWIRDRTGAELAAVLFGLAALGAVAVGVRLWRENRKLKQELAEAEAGYPTYGLPVGAKAPDFNLLSTQGHKISLEELTAQGRPVGLIFVGPSCGSCWVLMPHLARWQQTLADRLTLVMISTGTPKQNEEAIAEHGIAGIFLHDGAKLLDKYRVPGTPTSVIVSPDGRIVSNTVVGSKGVEPLIRLMLQGADGNGATSTGVTATSAAA